MKLPGVMQSLLRHTLSEVMKYEGTRKKRIWLCITELKKKNVKNGGKKRKKTKNKEKKKKGKKGNPLKSMGQNHIFLQNNLQTPQKQDRFANSHDLGCYANSVLELWSCYIKEKQNN